MSLSPFQSRIIVDVGISMGDEGKGRLIPEVSDELKALTSTTAPVGVVMKVNGGANSGHTVADLALNLIPAGVVDASIPHLGIGAGVVADPRKLRWEIAYVEHHGYEIRSRLRIDEKTHVSDLSHRLLDLAWEDYRTRRLGEAARGSTARGISPAYTDETNHFPISYQIFLGSKDVFVTALRARVDRAMRTIRYVCQVEEENWFQFFDVLTESELRKNSELIDAGYFLLENFDFSLFRGEDPFSLNEEYLVEEYWAAGAPMRENICDLRELLLETLAHDRYVIGEFGQSFWLDKRRGFVPNLTASHTYTPEFFESAGIPMQPIHTIGVCKAYDTKVGTHVFVTQLPENHPLSNKLKKLEFGTATGRQRMVGWFDAVEKGDALRFGGFQDLTINKLDALSFSDGWHGGELLVCVAYRSPDGTLCRRVPRNDSLRKKLSPVYLQLPGWSEDISEARHFSNLPKNAIRYVATLVKSVLDVAYGDTGFPSDLPNLRYIGVGPDRSQIISDIPETEDLIRVADSFSPAN